MKLKSKKVIKRFSAVFFPTLIVASCLLAFFDINWNSLDYKAIDFLYKRMVAEGSGPKVNERIVYLTITDKTYQAFSENSLNRERLAEANNLLNTVGPQALMYDIIFSRRTNKSADSAFQKSIESLGSVYLPLGLDLATVKTKFREEKSSLLNILAEKYSKKPSEIGTGSPYYAKWGIMQYDDFADVAAGSGFISVIADDDGVLRFVPLVINLGDRLIPQISFSMFLDYMQVPFEDIIIEWGKCIRIPASKGSFLQKEMIIPIDERGCTFIPFPQRWEKIKTMMELQNFLNYGKQEEYSSSLANFFEGKFVFLGDIAVGLSDVGQTSLEKDVPWLVVHGALMNGLLENTFYSHWNNASIGLLFFGLGTILFFTIILRRNLVFYLHGLSLPVILFGFTYSQLQHFKLFPPATIIISLLLLYIFMLVLIQHFTGKDQIFIREAFAKYVAPTVVEKLIDNPDQLYLGGEGKTLSILFTDIVGFTTISEQLEPTALVSLLKKYLTAMTSIVLENRGTIDKYLGDGILAEFGAPIEMKDHADASVLTGLKMLQALPELNKQWNAQGLPSLECRIGINTGYVIVGNLGSEQVFDYTVLGDTANLASRLEGANKQYNTKLMISDNTLLALTPGLFRTRLLDVIKVKGKNNAVKVYEVTGLMSEELATDDAQYYTNYEQGMEAYLLQQFPQAVFSFEACLQIRADDIASVKMLNRIKNLEISKLPNNWDGAFSMTEK